MEQNNEYNFNDILGLALDMGRCMLECGGEVSRSEDSAKRICRAYGAKRIEIFSILSLITGTIIMPDGTQYTQTRRIGQTGTNLHRLERLNSLSRRICKEPPPPHVFAGLLAHVERSVPYSRALAYPGAVCAVLSWTLYFGGSISDAVCACIIALIITFIDLNHSKVINRIIYTLLVCAIAGALSHILVMLGLGKSLDSIMIGTIMLLIPGMAIGNALRDMICDDIIAGSSRLIQALLLAVAIALGFALGLALTGGVAV
ncbi:MAG: threonine/serine exporter family protein [Clostridiales bacterium]|nr:threonine/serine exporter family protein [Clostridiales bacterium]